MKVDYRSSLLPFKYPFTISRGTKTHQPALIVTLEFRGLKGYGEAPAISYYDITVDQMIADLESKRVFLEKFSLTEPERYWHYLHHLFPKNPFLVCALDIAAWDLYGQLLRKPLYQIWKLDRGKAPLTDLTIGLDEPGKMLDKMRAQPWPIYKIKLGREDDLDILRRLRAETDAKLRVDANAGWTLQEALERLPELEALGIELIEQPLAKEDWEGMKLLHEQSRIPLIADESCVFESDVARCDGYFHGINIKLTKCSGITPALRMIAEARSRGLGVMIGSMNESTIGTAALAQLLPLVDIADIDGPLLLAEDHAQGLTYEGGQVFVTDRPGLGIVPI